MSVVDNNGKKLFPLESVLIIPDPTKSEKYVLYRFHGDDFKEQNVIYKGADQLEVYSTDVPVFNRELQGLPFAKLKIPNEEKVDPDTFTKIMVSDEQYTPKEFKEYLVRLETSFNILKEMLSIKSEPISSESQSKSTDG